VTELELALRELDVEWPPTPDISTAVAARLQTRPAERSARRARRAPTLPARPRAWVAAIAAGLALLVGGTLAVSPDARSAVLRWLGLESVEIERGTPSATPAPRSPLGRTLGLGTPIGAERARGLGARIPERLGEPDAIYETTLPDGTRTASLVYAPRDGLPESGVTGVGALVQTFPAQATPFIQKTIHSGADVEDVTADGARGYWITNAHGFAFESDRGVAYEGQRLADRTLLIERDGLLIRVEGALSRALAIEIAEDLIRDPS
jgi:hypothetical protein